MKGLALLFISIYAEKKWFKPQQRLKVHPTKSFNSVDFESLLQYKQKSKEKISVDAPMQLISKFL